MAISIMPVKNHHEEAFSPETIAKLTIFEDYAQAWIPTFVMQGREKEICIFDFFSGPGYDVQGTPGSPVRILMKIREYLYEIFRRNVRVRVFLNEFDSQKFEYLKLSCMEFLKSYPDVSRAISIEYFNEDFSILFDKLLPIISASPSLVYLDQNGVKFLSEEYLKKLEATSKTDFICFVSSSYLWRFGEQNEFQKYLSIDMKEVKNKPFKFINRSLIDALRGMLSPDTDLKLYPFSIKKGSNIHGIIFGASHPRAVEKFLTIAWKQNSINGEANFDIDDEEQDAQLDIFSRTGAIKLSKIDAFQKLVREKIISRSISNNYDLFNFVLAEGHIGKHAADVLREMKRNGEVSFDAKSPFVTYEKVYKSKKKLTYKVVGT